jgi:hypothetical protein
VSYPLAGFSDQSHHAALVYAVPMTKLSRWRSRDVLRDQAIDRVSGKPLANPSFPATVTVPNWVVACL